MHHQEFEPPEALRDTIKCLWYNRRDSGNELSGYEVQPDGYAEIIFHFGNGISIVRGGELHLLPSPFMMGLLDQPVTFYAKNRLEIIGIRCFPWTVFNLLGLPANREGTHIFTHPITQLQPALNMLINAGKVNEAIIEVERYFSNMPSRSAANSMLRKAGIVLQQTNGVIPVSQVATAAHATVRTLERNFKQSSGHTVKDVSALMRFEQVRNRLWLYPHSNLAGLAHELGYTDQSHLSREFKRYSGATPAAFARKARKGNQVMSSDFVAFVQA